MERSRLSIIDRLKALGNGSGDVVVDAAWDSGGSCFSTVLNDGAAVATSLKVSQKYIVVSLDNSKVLVFNKEGKLRYKLDGHTRGVWALALRGDTLVSAGEDRVLRVWDLATGNWGHILRGHVSTIRDVQIVNEETVISGSKDTTLRIWNMLTGRCKGVLKGHESTVRSLVVVGDIVVSASYDETARVWSISEARCLHILAGHTGPLYSVAFDGERVVTGSLDCRIRVWDAASGVCRFTFHGHSALVSSLHLRGDILASSDTRGHVQIWSLEDMSPIHWITHSEKEVVTPLGFDYSRILSGGDGNIKIWDFVTGCLTRELAVDAEDIWKVELEDNKFIVVSSKADQVLMHIWSFTGLEDDVSIHNRVNPSAKSHDAIRRFYQVDPNPTLLKILKGCRNDFVNPES